MFIFLAICALLLSALGLYTLVSLSVLNRTKEVGIRKVHGASISRIMMIITRPFTLIIILASIIGCVAGHYMSKMLMSSVFSVHMNPNTLSFAIPLVIIILTSITTIVWRVYSAALQNPAQSLRYE